MLTARTLPFVLLAPLFALAPPPPGGLVNTDVTFTSDGQSLHGTIISPPGHPTGRPGVVIVAGAGSTQRDDYRPEAEAYARAGIVALIYDKRAGYSRATTNFDDLADDALAGVDVLRSRPEVAPSLVGLWGHSQGGWVVPLAATKSDHVAFAVTVAAGGLPTARTQLWSNSTYLAHAGVAPELIGPIGTNLSRILIAANLFGDTTYDPVATLAKVKQPLLGIFADNDRSTAPGESLALFKQALDRGHNEHYTLRVIHDASHTLQQSKDGFVVGPDWAPGAFDLMTGWVNRLAASGPPAASADQPPAQAAQSEPVAPLSWYESPGLQVVVVVLLLALFGSYPVGAVVRKLRGRGNSSGRCNSSGRWPGRLLAAVGPVTVLGTLSYLFYIVQSGSTGVRSSVLGRPLLWLLLQIGAVGVVGGLVAAVGLGLGLGRRTFDVRLGAVVVGGVLFLPWAAYWGLFTV